MDDTDEFNVVVMPKRSLQSGSSLLALLKGGSESTEEQMSFDGSEGEREFAPEEHSPERSIESLPLESISYNPHQTREIEEEADLAELAASIALKGVLQPILVRPTPEGETPYELVAGERRLRASRLAGKSEVPAIVQEMNDQESVEISIIENAQREDLNPIEEAKAYRILVSRFGMNQGEVAAAVGKNRTTVANALRLLQLEESVIEMLENNELSAGHGRALLRVKAPRVQVSLATKAARLGLSVRALEVLAARYENLEGEITEDEVDEEVTQLNRLAERVGNFLGLEQVLLKKDSQGRKRLSVVFDTEASWKRFMSKIRD